MLIRLRAARGLFTALDNCTDIVQITDNNHKVMALPRDRGMCVKLSELKADQRNSFTLEILTKSITLSLSNCQAKVQVQVQSLKSKSKVKSKVFKSKRTWTLLTLKSYSPPPPTHH